MAPAKTSSAARAAGEAAGKPVVITVLGKKFNGPAKLPSTFAIDAAMVAGGDEGGLYRILISVFGVDDLGEIRELIAKKSSTDGGSELLGQVVSSITDAYGLSEGE